MASSQTTQQPPPLIDSTLAQLAPLAFGNWALPKLLSELQDTELLSRQRGLSALQDLLHDHEHAYEAIFRGCMGRLKILLKDEDSVVRIKTTEVLYVLASHCIGRDAFLRDDILSPLATLMDDPEISCRKNLHHTLRRIAEFPLGAVFMVNKGLMPRLVQRVSEEEEEIRAVILSTLSCCLSVNALPALESDVILVLKDQLSHQSRVTWQAATSALMAISIPEDGKIKICEEGLLPILVKLLSDKDQTVVASAAGTIMNTAVISTGKFKALEAGAIDPLLELVMSENTAVCANALRALTVLAEVPLARAHLLEHLAQLKTILSHHSAIIQRAASTAIEGRTITERVSECNV